MRKLMVVLTVVAFLMGLALPALADEGYHKVLEWTTTGWVSTDKASLYSEGSGSGQYRYENEAQPCFGPYIEPHPQSIVPGVPAVQLHVKNDLHLFPWIECDITENHLTWDIFKPGDYMAKVFIVQLQANCPVQVHLGTGTWLIPGPLVDGKLNGHIDLEDFTKEGPDNEIEDKIRIAGLLRDAAGAEKNPEGTPTDEIMVRYTWYEVWGEKPDLHLISDAELDLLPPKDEWIPAPEMNCESIIVLDSDELHLPENYHVVFYEDVEIEPCDSEGKYQDLFAITITPDP